MRIFILIVFYTLVATLAAWGLYVLGGGEAECFRNLAVNDHPLTCLAGFSIIISGLLSFIAAVLMVPLWLWLRSARWLPRPSLLSLGFSAIGPILLGVFTFKLRQPHAGAVGATWEAFELAAPLLIALAAVALSSRSVSLRRE